MGRLFLGEFAIGRRVAMLRRRPLHGALRSAMVARPALAAVVHTAVVPRLARACQVRARAQRYACAGAM